MRESAFPRLEEEPQSSLRGIRSGEPVPATETAGPARGVVSLEAEILPPQTADQTRTTLSWEILLENHQQIDACALVLRNQYPAQSFPRIVQIERGSKCN